MNQNDYHIEYKLDGECFKYNTTSRFLAEKMVSNLMSFADIHNMPLWKTQLKLIVHREHYQQCCFTVGKLDGKMLIANLHYN